MDDCLETAARKAFAASYGKARDLFIGAAPIARSYPCAAAGPDGEALYTDVSWIGDPDAANVCVVLSAVHGVEGQAGSAVQADLALRPLALPDDHALMLIHAVNPYGFAWDRRVTEEGCDLNRNFVDFAEGLPANEGYEALAPYLLPTSLKPQALEAAEVALQFLRREMGERDFQIARKSGQYTHPKGMFYGGDRPTNARRVLEQIAVDFRLSERRFVSVIDLHTGLGPYGHGEIQSENEPGSLSHRLGREVFGHALTSPALGTSFAVPVVGSLQLHWERLMGEGRYLYVCLEFGTFEAEAGRKAYILDHFHHGHGDGDPHSDRGRAVRAAMRSHFAPEEMDWKQMVLFRARQVIRQAVDGMVAMDRRQEAVG